MAFLADEAEAAVEGRGANIQKSLIGRRIVPGESAVLVRKTHNHAVVIGGLSKEQFPRLQHHHFAAELPNHWDGLRGVPIKSFSVAHGCFNNDICAHSSVLSVSWSMAVLPHIGCGR